jgi:hypothetical protein
MPHRWKSAKTPDFHTMLGKASHKTARLSHISHSLGGDGPYPYSVEIVKPTGLIYFSFESLQPMGRTA